MEYETKNKTIDIDELNKKAIQLLPLEYIDNHCADLYLKVCPKSTTLINNYKYKNIVTTFKSNIAPYDLWYNVPFAYVNQLKII